MMPALVNVQLHRHAGTPARVRVQQGMLNRNGRIVRGMKDKRRRMRGGNVFLVGKLLAHFRVGRVAEEILHTAEMRVFTKRCDWITHNRAVGPGGDFADEIVLRIVVQVRLRGSGGDEVAAGAEPHDADAGRINAELRGIGTEEAQCPAGIGLWGREFPRRDPVIQDGADETVRGEECGERVAFVGCQIGIAAAGTDQDGGAGLDAEALGLKNDKARLRLVGGRIIRGAGRPEWQSGDLHDVSMLVAELTGQISVVAGEVEQAVPGEIEQDYALLAFLTGLDGFVNRRADGV